MGTRVSYPFEVKMKAIEMRLAGVPVREVMEELNIRNRTQLKTWMSWYRNGELHRLKQPVGNSTPLAKDLNTKMKQRGYKKKIVI